MASKLTFDPAGKGEKGERGKHLARTHLGSTHFVVMIACKIINVLHLAPVSDRAHTLVCSLVLFCLQFDQQCQ